MALFWLWLLVWPVYPSHQSGSGQTLHLTEIRAARLAEFFELDHPLMTGILKINAGGQAQTHRSAAYRARKMDPSHPRYLYLFQTTAQVSRAGSGLGLAFWPGFDNLVLDLDLNHDQKKRETYVLTDLPPGHFFEEGSLRPDGSVQEKRKLPALGSERETRVLEFLFGSPDRPFRQGTSLIYGAISGDAPVSLSIARAATHGKLVRPRTH